MKLNLLVTDKNVTNHLFAAFLWATLYFLFGFLSHQLNGSFVATGYIWLPAGITVSALLLTPTARWMGLLLLLMLAQLLLGWLEQRDLFRMALFAIDEIGVAAIAVWLVRRAPFPMEGLYFLRGLLMVGVGASLVSGTFGAAWFAIVQDMPFWPTLRIWALSDLVGILIMTPVLAGWSQFRAMRSGGIERTESMLGLGAFVAVIFSAYQAFDGNIESVIFDIHFSTTYIPLFFIALVTLLWGGRGGSLSVVVLALIAFVYNSLGRGPFVELLQLKSGNALLELQVYLAVASLLSLLISALKTTREQLHEETASWLNQVELALSASRQLLYCIDPQRQTVTWRGDTQTILGIPASELTRLDQVLALVHPLDQERLRQRWFESEDDEDGGDAREDMSFRLLLKADRRALNSDGADSADSYGKSRIIAVQDKGRSLLDTNDRLTFIAGAWVFNAVLDTSEQY